MPVIDLGSVVGPQGQQGVAGATGAQGIQGNPGPNQVTDQTSTNLNGVLFGNQSRVAVKPVDSTPTADSTNLVSSGGTDKAIKARMPVYGMGENLLDNWYLVGGGSQQGAGNFPINQRGQTSYSGTGYGIDRWKQTNSNIQQVVQSDCLRMNGVSAVSGNVIYCYFYCPKLPAGTYTLSILVKEATGSGNWYVSSDSSTGYSISNVRLIAGLVTITFTATGNETSQSFYLWHQGALAVGDHLDLIAVKLELGTEQTLCHNEGTTEAPVWVLNEIPNYGEQFEKCVTSTADSTDTYANQAPESMRGFVPLIYEGTMPADGGAVDQLMFSGYSEYYLVDMQYLNANNSTYGFSTQLFTASPFLQYTKGNRAGGCKIRFTITSNASINGRPFYVMVLAKY